MTSLAPPKSLHDCARTMHFEHDTCWCTDCKRTWVIGPSAWEEVPAQHRKSTRERALRDAQKRSNAS